MSEEKTILLSIKLDTGDLKKNADIASAKLEELKIKQAILKGENKQGTVEYAKLNAEIKAQTLVLNQSSKSLEINERLGNKQNLSLKEQGELLSAGKTALRNLTAEQIANTDSGKQLNKEVNDLNESLKKSEAGYGVHVREVGNYDKGIRGLKAELKDLKSQMVGLDAGSEEYQQASEKAGELGDKIKEVNENVKASSGGTGFEKLSNNLELVQGDLMNLDFAGVSEKMKQMAVISKGMTFKEVLGSLKSMGSALISLGKAILMNPLFLLAGVIIGIVGALKMWSDSVKQSAIKAQENHTASILRTIDAMQRQRKLSEKITELTIKQAELEGKSLEAVGKLKLKALEKSQSDDVKERLKYYEAIKSAKKSYDLADDEETKKKYKDEIKGLRDQHSELKDKAKTYGLEKKNLETEINNGIRDEQKANNEKIIADDKTATDKRTAKQIEAEQKRLDFLNKLADLQLANEDKSNQARYDAIETKYNAISELTSNSAEDLINIEKQKNAELDALDVEAKDDALNRAKIEYDRSIKDADGNKKLIVEIERSYTLEKTNINTDYENKKKERDAKSVTDTEQFTKAKLESERKASQELKSINAELAYVKAKGTDEEKAMFEAFQQSKIDTLRVNAEEEIRLNKLTGDAKLAVEGKLALDTEKITGEKFKKTEEKETEETEKKLTKEQEKAQKTAEITLQSATQLTDALSSITQNRIAKELADEQNKNDENQKQLQSQLDAGLITEAEFKTKKAELDATFKATESKLKTEAFQKEKQANLIKAVMNTALGVTGALPNVPLSILAGVLGAVQIGLIASQPVPKFSKGGLFGGQSHANGGTKGVFSDGTQIEVEKDESFFILNKRATPLISQLSNLNTSTGGVPLMANGGTLKFQNGGAVASSLSNNLDNQLNAQNQLLRMIELMPKPVVVVQDINDAQGNLASVENRANF
jgi:hypothetical protein